MSRTIAPTRPALLAAYAGLALTVAAIVVLYIDHASGNVLAAHIRDGYPDYSQSRINTAATIYLVYLSILAGLGVLAWLITIWMIARRSRIARWLAVGLFVISTGIALFNLLVTDTSGETGLPAVIGWAGLLPCAAGLVAAIMLRRPRSSGSKGLI